MLGRQLPLWSVAPFAALLLSIALLPLVAPRLWEHNRHKAMVAALCGAPVAVWMGVLDIHLLAHAAHEYASFIILLAALFVISGGIVVRGTLAGTPGVNTVLLAIGAILASLIGTTGASMVLIRPLLRANSLRRRKAHLIIFFIFVVSNSGGLLTPLGDPPLFLGFLRGVPFLWTLKLLPEWAAFNAVMLVLFYIVDSTVFRREDVRTPGDLDQMSLEHRIPIHVAGVPSILSLSGVVVIILAAGHGSAPPGVQEAGMIAMALLALWATPKALHRENGFSWAPMIEVAVLFAGIFATMIPALAILNARGAELGLTEPWQFFWASGALSSFLDNAPTYLAFTAAASGLMGTDAARLGELLQSPAGERLLRAVSLGSVLMGANTYVGNGPNFMVKAIAEQAGVKMPSFFGYMLWSACILLPLFVLVTVVFLGR